MVRKRQKIKDKLTMKTAIIILAALVLNVKGCGQTTNKQLKNENMENTTETSKQMPENTLAVIQAENRTIYLIDLYIIGPIDMSDMDMLPNSFLMKARATDTYLIGTNILQLEFIEGDYPNAYAIKSYYINFFPEDKMLKLSLWLNYHINYKNGEKTIIFSTDYVIGEWENAGYSTDNSLWAKIYEYYLENTNH